MLLQFVSLLLFIRREIIDLSHETSTARICTVFVSSRRADWLLGEAMAGCRDAIGHLHENRSIGRIGG